MGDGFIFENRAIELALAAQVIVVSVDYRLAPEHPFPAALARAGVDVELHQELGSLHGFLGSPDRAKRIGDMSALAIKQALWADTIY